MLKKNVCQTSYLRLHTYMRYKHANDITHYYDFNNFTTKLNDYIFKSLELIPANLQKCVPPEVTTVLKPGREAYLQQS